MVEGVANRGRRVTFHAGPRGDCAAWMRTVDVHEVYRVEGVPSGLDARRRNSDNVVILSI